MSSSNETVLPVASPLAAAAQEKAALPSAPIPVMGYKTPKNTLLYIIKSGMAKGEGTVVNIFIMSFLSGVFVGFGGLLAITVAGGMKTSADSIGALSPGLVKFTSGALFPVALFLIIFTGGELFTGNVMALIAANLAGKSSLKKLAKSWSLAYIGNFAGCAFMAYFGTYLAEMLDHDPWLAYIMGIGHAKTHLGFGLVFLRGIFANWLVCLAVYLGIASESFEGKVIGMWWPIMTFAAIGYEHCIANMYYIMTALMYGHRFPELCDFTFGDFIAKSLIPSTLGNIIGGGFFVAGLYYFVYREHTAAAVDSMSLKQGKHRSKIFPTLPHFHMPHLSHGNNLTRRISHATPSDSGASVMLTPPAYKSDTTFSSV